MYIEGTLKILLCFTKVKCFFPCMSPAFFKWQKITPNVTMLQPSGTWPIVPMEPLGGESMALCRERALGPSFTVIPRWWLFWSELPFLGLWLGTEWTVLLYAGLQLFEKSGGSGVIWADANFTHNSTIHLYSCGNLWGWWRLRQGNLFISNQEMYGVHQVWVILCPTAIIASFAFL